MPAPPRASEAIEALAELNDSGFYIHKTAASFAKIIVDLFPPWFDFGPEKFALLAWGRGLHVVISGPCESSPYLAVISTSDSRVMRCTISSTRGGEIEDAEINMHYQPTRDQAERARMAIALVLHRLYPDRVMPPDVADVAARVRDGRVFPAEWRKR